MATTLQTFTGTANTDPTFQDVCTKIDTNILGFGWQNSADTGQITPASVTHPSSNTDAGFRMYNTNDGLTTWYLKVTFGLDGSNKFRLKLQLGTGTNGSGTLSGQTSSIAVLAASGLAASSTQLAMAGDAGRLTIVIGGITSSSSQVSYGIAIGRTVDTSGSANSTGMEIFVKTTDNSVSTVWQQCVPASGTIPSAEGSGFRCVFTAATSALIGSTLRYGHPFTWAESTTNNPTLCAMLWAKNDYTAGAATTKALTLYSTTHTFLLDGDGGIGNMHLGNSNARIGWRYE